MGRAKRFARAGFWGKSPDGWVRRDVVLEHWKAETGKKRSVLDTALTALVKAKYVERGKGELRGHFRLTTLGKRAGKEREEGGAQDGAPDR